jgi:hypothetical protein
VNKVPNSLQELLDEQRKILAEELPYENSAMNGYLTDDIKEFLSTAEEFGIKLHGPTAALALTIIAQEVIQVLRDVDQISMDGTIRAIDTLNDFANALLNLPRRNQ